MRTDIYTHKGKVVWTSGNNVTVYIEGAGTFYLSERFVVKLQPIVVGEILEITIKDGDNVIDCTRPPTPT